MRIWRLIGRGLHLVARGLNRLDVWFWGWCAREAEAANRHRIVNLEAENKQIRANAAWTEERLQGQVKLRDEQIEELVAVIARNRERVEAETRISARRGQDAISGLGLEGHE